MLSISKLRVRLTAGTAIVFLLIFFSPRTQSEAGATIGMPPAGCQTELLKNGDFELANPDDSLLDWTTDQWRPSATFSRDVSNAHSGASSVKITAPTLSDARYLQEVTVEPDTQYMLSGWIKTENVAEGAGANLSFFGTWTHTDGLVGTNDWTRVSLWFKSGSDTRITIGARLGYSAAPSSGTVWFDDLRLTRITPDGTHPHWKILVLIYDRTDAVVTDTGGKKHHMVGAMTPAEVERAALAATEFVETDIPALTSGNMVPELTIRYPDHPLTQLDTYGQGWWPSPANTVADRDRTFDSVIVIWDPRVVDQYTGIAHLITGGAAGLGPSMGPGQTYLTIIIQAATEFGHRNVFKHEWGHSILYYFETIGATPRPTVANHADINQYVHWPNGDSYVWLDETDANPIPNSIYNNESGFTHDYYSGTTATPDQPTRRLGITPEAWMFGGPVTKPGLLSSGTPPAITCSGNIIVAKDAWLSCSARVIPTPPTVIDACDSNLTAVGTRSDGLPLDAPYSCGQTVITWTATNSENLTSSCQQVVTVTDAEPPAFTRIPPPVNVTTGPGATSCGAVVEDSQLISTTSGANPVMLDPTGDLRDPSSPLQNDMVSGRATFDNGSLTFTVTFADRVFAPSSDSDRRLRGFIELDTDQNPDTGHRSIVHVAGPTNFSPYLNVGVDYRINLTSESLHPGFVEIGTDLAFDVITGTVPILFEEKSFTIVVPLVMLGGDNGLVNYGIAVGVGAAGTDRLPNGVEPAVSAAVPELIAIDNCAGVTVSRTGVPANNFFSVGETLITYTATDVSGNAVSVTQMVTVVDDTPPVISRVAATPSTLWPPNRGLVDVTVTYDAADNCGIGETWLSVHIDEANEANERGTASDWEILDAHHMRLRAARSGRWGPRVYTITITAKDIHGNVSTQNVTVMVPHSKGEGDGKS